VVQEPGQDSPKELNMPLVPKEDGGDGNGGDLQSLPKWAGSLSTSKKELVTKKKMTHDFEETSNDLRRGFAQARGGIGSDDSRELRQGDSMVALLKIFGDREKWGVESGKLGGIENALQNPGETQS